MKKPTIVTRHAGKALLHSLILSGVALSSAGTRAATRSWDGATGPFGTNTNWSEDTVPVGGDTAIIGNGGTATVTTGDTFSVANIRLGDFSGVGSISQSGGSVTATNQVIIGGNDSNGGSGIGSLTMTAGTFAGGGAEMWIGSKGGQGTLNLSGTASFTNNNWIIFGRDGGGVGNATLGGSASISKTGGNHIAVGLNSGATSTVTLNNSSSMSSNNEVRIGWLGATTQGVLNVNDTATVSSNGNFQIGQESAKGAVTLNGNAALSSNNELYVGNNGAASQGTLIVNDSATVSVTNGLVVGRQNATGTMTVSDNAEVVAHGYLVVGADGAGTGTLTVNDNASVSADRMIWISQAGTSSGTIHLNGGTLTGHAGLPEHDATGAGVAFRGASGTLNLNGGTLETPGFNKVSGTVAINFNGATLEATGNTNTGSFFNNIASSELNIQAGGAIFDTNGNSITVTQDLAGVGGLTKLGAGSLILTGTGAWLGDTVIEGGTLSINTTFLADDSNVYLSGTGVFDLDFAGTDTINMLFLDGVAQGAGTWGGLSSLADNKSAFFTGDGILLVTVPEPAEVSLAIAGGLIGLAIVRRRRKTASA